MTTNNDVPNWRDSAYELCAWAASRSIPMTPAMMQCMMLATGDGNKHPNPINELARAALSDTSQPAMPADEVMEMALCESRRLVLRIGQAYRFVPMDGCATCETMKKEHDDAYGDARRIEGE